MTDERKPAWGRTIIVGLIVLVISALYLWARRWGTSFESVAYKLSFTSVAVAGTYLLATSFLFGPLARFFPSIFARRLYLRKYYGLVGFFAIIAHVVWGFLTLNPSKYSALFSDGAFKPSTILFILAGLTGFVLFFLVAITSAKKISKHMTPKSWKAVQRIGYLALFAALVHFSTVKYTGWAAVEKWPYLPDSFSFLSSVPLPPLSLILFLYIAFVFVMRGLTFIFPSKH